MPAGPLALSTLTDYANREPATGLTLLVVRPGPEGWRIVQDASM